MEQPHCGFCDLDKVLGMTSLPFLFFINSGGYGWLFPVIVKKLAVCLSLFWCSIGYHGLHSKISKSKVVLLHFPIQIAWCTNFLSESLCFGAVLVTMDSANMDPFSSMPS
jgi:hypothetical protein